MATGEGRMLTEDELDEADDDAELESVYVGVPSIVRQGEVVLLLDRDMTLHESLEWCEENELIEHLEPSEQVAV